MGQIPPHKSKTRPDLHGVVGNPMAHAGIVDRARTEPPQFDPGARFGWADALSGQEKAAPGDRSAAFFKSGGAGLGQALLRGTSASLRRAIIAARRRPRAQGISVLLFCAPFTTDWMKRVFMSMFLQPGGSRVATSLTQSLWKRFPAGVGQRGRFLINFQEGNAGNWGGSQKRYFLLKFILLEVRQPWRSTHPKEQYGSFGTPVCPACAAKPSRVAWLPETRAAAPQCRRPGSSPDPAAAGLKPGPARPL